jgi:hypothetical protein
MSSSKVLAPPGFEMLAEVSGSNADPNEFHVSELSSQFWVIR